MMKLIPFCLVLSLPIAGCGPNSKDFAGVYTVTAQEAFPECDRGGNPRTPLADVTSIEIVDGTDADMVLNIGQCGFGAEIVDETHFTVAEESCIVSDAAGNTGTISLAGEGSLQEETLDLALSGFYYYRDTFGYDITCHYTLNF